MTPALEPVSIKLMNRPAAIRIPRLPAAARKAGATQIARCSDRVFTVGFALEGSSTDDADWLSKPGNGPAVAMALVKWAGDDFTVEWKGEQRYGIVLTARGA